MKSKAGKMFSVSAGGIMWTKSSLRFDMFTL